MEFQVALNEWIDDPSAVRTDDLRDAIQCSANYSSGRELTSVVVPLLESGAFQEARNAVLSVMPGSFLSPAAHTALSRAYLGLGDDEAADRERSFARASLVSILNSGDGTRDSPWVVLRITDEYDVVAAMGTRVSTQSVEQRGSRVLDELTTEDGQALWFELRGGGRRTGPKQ
ncbi:MAG: DUF4919 domain-containing protein [Propionibacteriaceae bacterium]|nr:DUF4919 domain-containing protein [Propionibacteriaceae bacterium]